MESHINGRKDEFTVVQHLNFHPSFLYIHDTAHTRISFIKGQFRAFRVSSIWWKRGKRVSHSYSELAGTVLSISLVKLTRGLQWLLLLSSTNQFVPVVQFEKISKQNIKYGLYCSGWHYTASVDHNGHENVVPCYVTRKNTVTGLPALHLVILLARRVL